MMKCFAFALLIAASPTVPGRAFDFILIPAGSTWRYSGSEMDPGTAWWAPDFDDTGWLEGPAKLGFGDGDEATVIGPPTAPTFYFRRGFSVGDPFLFSSLKIGIRHDDGAVVYINGQQVVLINMPPGPISYSTRAVTEVEGLREQKFDTFTALASLLVPGLNTIAAEVHQSARDSLDLGFDLELIGTGSRGFIRGDANGDGSIDLGDVVACLLVLFTGEPTDCLDSLDTDDSGYLEITDAIQMLEYLFLDGPAPAWPFPWPGDDPTPDDLDCRRS